MVHVLLRQGMLLAKCGVGIPSPTRTVTAAARAAAAMATKRKAVNIGTHSGTFHCDEALGCWMLKQTEQFAGVPDQQVCLICQQNSPQHRP